MLNRFTGLTMAVFAVAFLAAAQQKIIDRRDGKVYRIVKIDSQNWMAENLNYAAEGSVCYENNANNCAKYGRLYNWNTANKVCPAGFHLPHEIEWAMLAYNVGGYDTAGAMLKSRQYWNSYSGVSASNDKYGFAALPGGNGNSDDTFNDIGNYGYWWSATRENPDFSVDIMLGYGFDGVYRSSDHKASLLSVRCVEDLLDRGGNPSGSPL